MTDDYAALACAREGCGHDESLHDNGAFPPRCRDLNDGDCACPAYQPAPAPTASPLTLSAAEAAHHATQSPAERTPIALVHAVVAAVAPILTAGLDAETRRADAAEAEVTRLTAEVLNAADLADEAIIEQRDAARAERDSLGERIAAVRALCDDPDTPHAGSCASYRVFRTADGPYPCDCIVSQIRRALGGTDAAHIARETT
jgi:hypothetical protein